MSFTATVSEEAIQKAEASIIPKVKSFLAKLESKSRRELKSDYMEVTGMEPNPRITKAWMVVALARIFQDRCWNEKIGQIPKNVAVGNARFWLSNSVMMMDPSSLKEEKKIERGVPCSEKASVLRYIEPELLWMKPIADFVSPWNETSPSEAKFLKFFNHLKRKKCLSFESISRWCSSQPGQIKLKPSLVYLEMEKRGAVVFLMQEAQSGELKDVRKKVSLEPVDEVLEATPNLAYRDSIKSNGIIPQVSTSSHGSSRGRMIHQKTNQASWKITSLSQSTKK